MTSRRANQYSLWRSSNQLSLQKSQFYPVVFRSASKTRPGLTFSLWFLMNLKGCYLEHFDLCMCGHCEFVSFIRRINPAPASCPLCLVRVRRALGDCALIHRHSSQCQHWACFACRPPIVAQCNQTSSHSPSSNVETNKNGSLAWT